jgi:predicted transcriptional regulator
MVTTIQISDSVKAFLDKLRFMERETYNDVLEFMIEDSLELNEKTKKEIEEARGRIFKGKTISHEEAKKRLGI